MTEGAVKRPPTLAGACFYLGVLAAVMSVTAVNLVSSWNAENRADDYEWVLSLLRDAGLGTESAESVYKVFLTVIAVLAACGVIFAVYTAKGQRSSRIGLTIATVVVGASAFTGALGGTFLFSLIGALSIVFTIRLWTGENGTYFRAVAGRPPRRLAPERVGPPAVSPVPSAQQAASPTQHPAPGWESGPPPGYGPPPGWTPPPGYGTVPGRERWPRSVSIAVWTTFVGSAIVAAGAALMLVVLGVMGADYEQLMSESPFSENLVEGSGMTYDQLYRSSLVISGLCLALSLGGLAASIRVLAKRRSGDVFLFVMAVVTIIVSVVFVPIGLPWAAAAIVVVLQLRRPESRGWFVKT